MGIPSEEKALYGFVVLNYNNYQDTIACVDSILRIRHRDDYRIVIVDNASSNNSFDELKRRYEAHPQVDLATTVKNKGYSGGNNLGIKMMRGKGINRVIVATNDTELVSLNLLDEFDQIDLSDVGIVGTDILTLEGVHQNPALYRPTLLYFLNLYLYGPMAWARANLYKRSPFMKHVRQEAKTKYIGKFSGDHSSMPEYSVYMLHGSFLYLTKTYLDRVGLLDENLFMYGEEDLMAWNCACHGLKELYLPGIKVLHKDAQATKWAHKEGKNDFVRAMTRKSIPYLTKQINAWSLMKLVLVGLRK